MELTPRGDEPRSSLRVAPYVRRVIAHRLVDGQSKSRIARELKIDRQTVTRVERDPETKQWIESLRAAGHATTSSVPRREDQPPVAQPAFFNGIGVCNCCGMKIVGPNVFEYVPFSEMCKCNPSHIGCVRPPTVAADQSSASPGMVLMTDGTQRHKVKGHVKFITDAPDDRRRMSSVPPWLRPTPKLAFWDY